MISIIIPVYGPEHLLTACLEALGTVDELILVDNATGYEFPDDAKAVRNLRNLGFAVACNQGAEIATGDVLVFLNVDTEVHEGWLEPLERAFDDPNVGMVGSKLVYPDGSIQHSGVEISLSPSAHGRNLKDDHPSGEVDGVTGACMAVRHSVFDEVGGFDEAFWNGYEDVDLCLKVRDAGYSIRYVAESVVTHHESATGGERWTGVANNVARLNEKWAGHELRPSKSSLRTGGG